MDKLDASPIEVTLLQGSTFKTRANAPEMPSLHDQIMNLPCGALPAEIGRDNAALALKVGHKQARHAAAELALSADAEIAAWRTRFPNHQFDKVNGRILPPVE